MSAVRSIAPAPPVTARTGTRLSWALLWSYAFTTGGYVITAALQVGITAVIDPRSFGVMVLAMVWVSLGLMLLQHGPTMAVIQHDDLTEEHADAAYWVTLAGTLVFTAGFAALAPLWAAVNHLPELTPVCLALTPVLLLTGASAVPDAVVRRRMDMRNIAVRGLCAAAVGGVAGLAGAIAGMGVWALVVQQLVSAVVYVVMLAVMAPWRPGRPRPRRIARNFRDLRRASGHTLFGAVGNFVSLRIDALLMGMFFAPAAVGIYRFGGRFAEMVVDITSRALQAVSLPELARHNQDSAKLAGRLGTLMHLAATVSLPPLALLAACAGPFVLVIGDQWAEAATPLRVLCLVSAVGVAADLLGPALQAAQRAAIPALFNWVGAGTYAVAFLGAVHLSAGHPVVDRLTTIAITVLVVRVLLVGAMGYVAYGRVLRVSCRPTLVAVVPAVAASGAAALSAAAVQAALGVDTRPIVALCAAGGAGSAAAGLVLYTIDAEVRRVVARLWRKVRGR